MCTLPDLPYGFAWRKAADGGGELTIWGSQVVAQVEPALSGWRLRVNVCFHGSLHQEAIAGTKFQACYWIHCWAIARAEAIYRARPESCVLVKPKTLVG